MQVMGSGLTYILKENEAYLVGKLDHDSFTDVSNGGSVDNFAFTIDTSDKYRTFENLKDLREFSNFEFPIDIIYDSNKQQYNAHDSDIIKDIEDINGKMIVQKIVYSNGLSPMGYIYFEFNIYNSEVRENQIVVNLSDHVEDYIKMFDIL